MKETCQGMSLPEAIFLGVIVLAAIAGMTIMVTVFAKVALTKVKDE